MKAKEFFIEIINEKVRKTDVAYEDVRINPKLNITEELSAGTVEDYILSLGLKIRSGGQR